MTRQVDVKALVSHIVRGDGVDKCRICMGDTTEGQVFLGDTVMMDGDKAVTLAELLELITGVEVETSSVLPNKLCMQCMAHITTFLPFLLLCRESSQRWDQITKMFDETKVSKKTQSIYVLVLKDIRAYSSAKTAANKTEALDNLKTNVSYKKFYTKIAANKNDTLDNLKTNVSYKKCYNQRIAKENQVGRMRKSPNMTCPECETTYSVITKFNKHIKNARKIMCVLCHTLLDIDAYKAHLNNHSVTVFACKSCPEAFLKEQSLNNHRSKHKGHQVCVDCNHSFVTSARLAAHLVNHQSEICPGCDKKFSNRICYTKHRQKCLNVENKKLYICDYCSKEFNKMNPLKYHIINNHLTRKQFQCDQCGRTFMSRIHLAEHGNTHNKILDRYVCTKCGSKFSTRRGHERHLKKHDTTSATSDSKPRKKTKYICPICKKVYYEKKSINNHLRLKHDVVKMTSE